MTALWNKNFPSFEAARQHAVNEGILDQCSISCTGEGWQKDKWTLTYWS